MSYPNYYGNNYQQQYVPYQPQQESFPCRPVTSREEALATPADFMRPLLLPDFAHNCVYVKRVNPNTGASDILEYRLFIPEAAPQYVTREEFEAFREEFTRKPKGRKVSEDES